MRVAVFSDIHGNLPALEAVLDDIDRQSVDLRVCAGDIVNPLRTSADTWNRIQTAGITCLRGNHEDYLLTWLREPQSRIRNSPQFIPVRKVAQHLGEERVSSFQELPLTLQISAPGTKKGKAGDLLICHASPASNSRSFFFGISDEMGAEIERSAAGMIVAGHIHQPWTGKWKETSLVIGGSTGLPLQGKAEASYVILEHDGRHWTHRHRSVPFDREAVLREYIESGWATEGGPIAWMLYDEFLTHQPRLAYFFPWLNERNILPSSLKDWESAAMTYLEQISRWSTIRKLLQLS